MINNSFSDKPAIIEHVQENKLEISETPQVRSTYKPPKKRRSSSVVKAAVVAR